MIALVVVLSLLVSPPNPLLLQVWQVSLLFMWQTDANNMPFFHLALLIWLLLWCYYL